jgi:hypothetical protein
VGVPTTPADSLVPPRLSGHPVVLATALLVSVLLTWANGLWWWFWATFTIGGWPVPGQYLEGAGACLGSAALVAVLPIVVTWVFRTPLWIAVLALVDAGTLVLLGIHSLDKAAASPADPQSSYRTLSDGLYESLWFGSWPLIALAFVALVSQLRVPSRPTPR